MCGIAGIVSFKRKVHLVDVIKMTDAIRHRGPDGEGHWISDDGSIALGHRRLSIIDLSDSGNQPMFFDNYVLIFNGEIYNYLELRRGLEEKGYVFTTSTDTEVLLKMYVEYGERCLSYLDGMFAFAIWNKISKELFCARDRFGEKPFYYFFNNDYFLFASEIKALFTQSITKGINHDTVINYLSYNVLESSINQSETYFENINKLEPAHFIKIDSCGKIQKTRYWEIEIKINNTLSLNTAAETFYELFNQSIRKRLRSDVAVGSSLSGGLDSSSIVCLINEILSSQSTNKNYTFSARFKNSPNDEGVYIDEIIKKTNPLYFYTYPDVDGFFKDLDKMFYFQEEPFVSTSQYAQWEVMKLAKQKNVTVLLDGQGADEILAGYQNFYFTYFTELYHTNKRLYSKEIKSFRNLLPENAYVNRLFEYRLKYPSVFKLIKKIRGNNKDVADLNIDYMSQYKKSSSSTDDKPYKTLNEALKWNVEVLGLHKLLHYGDRNSMAFSREVRLPFLDHQIVEFLFTLPPDFKIHDGWTKLLLRKSMQNILPAKICWRKDKIGFAPPQNKWFEDKRFKDLYYLSCQFLKSEKIITKPNLEKSWQYLMVYKLLNNRL